MNKTTKCILLIFGLLAFQNCINENDIDEKEIATESFDGNWSFIFSTNKISDDVYIVKNGYWKENEIFFSIDQENIIEVRIKSLRINDKLKIGLVSSPYATIKTTELNQNLYRTDIRPVFWVDGPINFNNLIYGGEAFYPEYYVSNNFEHIVQGGYLIIDSYNSKYISGKCWIKAWVFNKQLNREVSTGIYIEFKGLELKD